MWTCPKRLHRQRLSSLQAQKRRLLLLARPGHPEATSPRPEFRWAASPHQRAGRLLGCLPRHPMHRPRQLLRLRPSPPPRMPGLARPPAPPMLRRARARCARRGAARTFSRRTTTTTTTTRPRGMRRRPPARTPRPRMGGLLFRSRPRRLSTIKLPRVCGRRLRPRRRASAAGSSPSKTRRRGRSARRLCLTTCRPATPVRPRERATRPPGLRRRRPPSLRRLRPPRRRPQKPHPRKGRVPRRLRRGTAEEKEPPRLRGSSNENEHR